MAVLVEIGDDEQPVKQSANSRSASETPRERMGDLCYWTVMRCAEPTFWEFLGHTFPSADTVTNASDAAELLKFLCTVDSRKEFDTDPQARARFDRLIRHPYQKWALAKGLA